MIAKSKTNEDGIYTTGSYAKLEASIIKAEHSLTGIESGADLQQAYTLLTLVKSLKKA